MPKSPEKRNPSGSREYSTKEKITATLAIAGLGFSGLLLAGCSDKGGATEHAGSKTAQSATPTWTPNRPSPRPQVSETAMPSETNTQSAEYVAPEVENAVPASAILDEVFAIPSAEFRDGNFWKNIYNGDLKARAQFTAALMVDALKTREGYLYHMEEFKDGNPLFTPIKEMDEWRLAWALDYAFNIACTTPKDGVLNGDDVIDKNKALRTVTVIGGTTRGAAMYRHIDQLEKPSVCIDSDDYERTAKIESSEMIDVEGVGQVEMLTIYRTSSWPSEPPAGIVGPDEWRQRVFLIPMSALDELPIIYGTSEHSADRGGNYNRPHYSEELGTYVTSDNQPVLIPVFQ